MRAYRDEANSTLNKSLDRNNGFNIVQASTEYVAAANTLAILELAEQQRIANLIALAALPSDAPDELLELRTEAAFHLVEYQQNGLDDEHLAVLPEIAVSLGMNTDEADEYRDTDRYSTTERADTKPTREASTIGFIVEPYE